MTMLFNFEICKASNGAVAIYDANEGPQISVMIFWNSIHKHLYKSPDKLNIYLGGRLYIAFYTFNIKIVMVLWPIR